MIPAAASLRNLSSWSVGLDRYKNGMTRWRVSSRRQETLYSDTYQKIRPGTLRVIPAVYRFEHGLDLCFGRGPHTIIVLLFCCLKTVSEA